MMELVREDLEFCYADDWDRPLFVDKKGIFYCSTDQLIDANDFEISDVEDILENISAGRDVLYIKGRNPQGEPDFPVKYSTKR